LLIAPRFPPRVGSFRPGASTSLTACLPACLGSCVRARAAACFLAVAVKGC
jgi:hypothetical protein